MDDSISNLSTSLDKLSSSLAPLLSSNSPQNLSLLNRAKLHTLTAYAIESLLFSSLRLSGTSTVDLKSHPVMTELTRIKQYFEKIELTEKGRQGPRLRVDKGAAERFVRAGLCDDNMSAPAPSSTKDEHPKERQEMVESKHDRKRKGDEPKQDDDSESAKKRKKNSGSFKSKSNKVPKGPKEAFQALLKKSK